MIYIHNRQVFFVNLQNCLSHSAVYEYMRRAVLTYLLLFATIVTFAQNFSGKITDNQNEPVSNAVVILQSADAEFLRATTSDSLGGYKLQIDIPNGLVVVQHLAYENKTVEFSNGNYNVLKNIVLSDKANQLGGVTVSAGTSAVVVKDNALIYNAQHIVENKSVSNAFELLKYTPGITTRNDEIDLVGASQLTVIIDGKATMLSNSEIAEVLKAMPASRIANIEGMYKAPSKYGVRASMTRRLRPNLQPNTHSSSTPQDGLGQTLPIVAKN